MFKKQSISFIIAVVLLTPVTVFALVHWAEKKWNALPVLHSGTTNLPDFAFSNQDGETVTLAHWKGKIVVANFFFTHCPVICPKMTNHLKKVKAAFPGEKQLLVSSFTVDPARDSVRQLKSFAERYSIVNNSWHLLTGKKAAIYKLARENFAVTAEDGDGGEYDFIHSDKLVLLDAAHRIRGYYSGTSPQDVQQLIQDIKKLQNEK